MIHISHQLLCRYRMYSVRKTEQGYSLFELMLILTVILIIILIAYPYYRQHVLQGRLNQAKATLLINAQFLSKHYQKHISYKQNKDNWPELPIIENQHFCFRIQGNPRFAPEEHFTLKAVAIDTEAEPRIIKLNQDGRIFICQSSSSRCDEENHFFNGKGQPDKNCRIF